jgi:two-component system sensor histidine kinase ChiS
LQNPGKVAILDQLMAKTSGKLPSELRAAPRAQPIVLAVDDDPAILRIIESQLTRHDFTVMTASSGEEALEMLKRMTPSVLILDVMMDGISGYDLCHVVKRDRRLQAVPVIFLTSRGTPQDFKTGHDLGAVIYMVKPLKPEKLANIVQMLLPVSA